MHIFVLSGQSNMAGRGGVHHRRWDGVVPPECAPDPSIQRLSAELQWEEAREPLHADIDTAKTCGVGPGMVFARAVLPRLREEEGTPGGEGARTGTGLGLVPCAVGGTAIREWARGERLYEQMVCRSRVAARDGEIEAVLWYQGESDAESDADTAAYRGNIERLIANVRADLGMPHLPFIQVALASGDKRNIEKVRSAQLSVNMPNVVTVDAMGLALNEDNMHLTTESQVKLGKMLAEAYIKNFLKNDLLGDEYHEVYIIL
ncbi:putative carbohydrate esterase [Dichanthelium oligosanthes]|uniref:Putative carbohydrate esterase n=1 Tax=Dichanthelium oligosanthes TaxID=888268 RepID=A0A1E5UZX4_9POAL|nr:putative carbohydrate esterase [Dichanthelium oligosanthes]